MHTGQDFQILAHIPLIPIILYNQKGDVGRSKLLCCYNKYPFGLVSSCCSRMVHRRCG